MAKKRRNKASAMETEAAGVPKQGREQASSLPFTSVDAFLEAERSAPGNGAAEGAGIPAPSSGGLKGPKGPKGLQMRKALKIRKHKATEKAIARTEKTVARLHKSKLKRDFTISSKTLY